MIDTVEVRLGGRIRNKKKLPQGWFFKKQAMVMEDELGDTMKVGSEIVQHDATGLRIFSSEHHCYAVQVSLPRLIFEHNGYIIKTQWELQAAIKKLLKICSEVFDVPSDPLLPLARLDLVLNLPISPQALFRVFRYFTPKSLHIAPVVYPGGLFWKGEWLKCRLYDKKQHLTKKPGKIARLEWQLNHNYIHVHCGGGPITSDKAFMLSKLDLEECYKIYRRLSLGFQPKQILAKSFLPDLLALAERENFRPNGISLLDHFAHSRNKKRVGQMMKEVVRRQLAFDNIDLEEVLPPKFAGAPHIDVAVKGVKSLHPF